MSPWHWLAHRLGWNLGRVHSWTSADGTLMIGHRCSTCGAVAHAGPMFTQAMEDEIDRRYREQKEQGR